jgi:hypothetical protein
MSEIATIKVCGKLFGQFITVSLLLGSIALNYAAAQESPDLRSQTGNTSNDGHVKLVWTPVESAESYEIQQSADPGFETVKLIYQGPDLATFVSGLENGTYYYRVRAGGNNWSEVVIIQVQHHSLQLAFTLFGLGGVVFLLTVFVVVKGSVQSGKNPI